MLNERRRTVLSALVDEYIASVQPVGSKVLVERYHLGCSPATVRSELAALEETGLVFQPHVSAGRIPTDSGYRAYVNDVVGAGSQQLSTPEAEGVRRYYAELEHELTLDAVLLLEAIGCRYLTGGAPELHPRFHRAQRVAVAHAIVVNPRRREGIPREQEAQPAPLHHQPAMMERLPRQVVGGEGELAPGPGLAMGQPPVHADGGGRDAGHVRAGR